MTSTSIPKTFSLDQIELDKELGITTKDVLLVPQQRPPQTNRLFIKGPIPFGWLRRANAIGGTTGIVATSLWFYVGLNGAKTFKVDGRLDQLSGLSRQTRDKCLKRLHTHKLLRLSPHHGSYPWVQILDDSG
jgi:hypothetical protein